MIENIQQLLSWQPERQNPIIDGGILLPETRLMIFGQAKSWKSMLALHTAFSIANGTSWFGYKTVKAAALKIQVELPKAFDKERVEKYARSIQSYPPNIYFVTPKERMKLDTTIGISVLNKNIDELKRRCPDYHPVIILDPLYKMMAGHISDEYDVKKFQDNLDETKEKYHCTFIIIHHSRLTRVDSSGVVIDLGAEESMGSSYWNNWCDTMIRAKLLDPFTEKRTMEISFELTRNAQILLPNFEIQWDRANLQPTVTKRDKVELGEPSIRKLKEDNDD